MTRDPYGEEHLGQLIEMALAEDVGSGDYTTEWTVDQDVRGRAVVVAKAPTVVAGTEAARATFLRVDPSLCVDVAVRDGDVLDPGAEILTVEGGLRGILTAERVALNFLVRLSGIATLTWRFLEAVEGTGAKLLDTRKTTPGYRTLEKAAVEAGGGANHRQGLYDMILIKENHIVAAGGITAAVERVRRANRIGLEVEVEVTTIDELEEALAVGTDRILLDNMDLGVLAEAVSRIRARGAGRPLSEASGNMTLERVRSVAEVGVDLISIGALTHSAKGADISLKVVERWKTPKPT
jgi:nicotinate-nucleotide pyrophosphorylase (carboxylating)